MLFSSTEKWACHLPGKYIFPIIPWTRPRHVGSSARVMSQALFKKHKGQKKIKGWNLSLWFNGHSIYLFWVLVGLFFYCTTDYFPLLWKYSNQLFQRVPFLLRIDTIKIGKYKAFRSGIQRKVFISNRDHVWLQTRSVSDTDIHLGLECFPLAI